MPLETAHEPDDLRATIEATFTAAENVSGAGDATETSVSSTEEDVAGAAPGTPSTLPDRARNPDGTFAKGAADKAATEPEAQAEPETSTTNPAKASPEPSTAPAAPPAGWTPEAKAEWSKLSPAVQAAVAKRESEITNGGRQWSEQRRHYEAVLSPVAEEAARLGMDTPSAINALMAAHHALNRDPAEAIRRLAANYGVDLATLAGHAAPQDPNAQSQGPDISALVHRAVQPLIAPLQQRIAAEDRAREESTLSAVDQFATSPGHEHFDSVVDELMAFVPQIKRSNPSWSPQQVLQEAYDRAVYANPGTRQSVLAAREAAAEEARRKAATERATSARRAASSVTGHPAGRPAEGPRESLREEIEAAFASAR